MGLIPNKIPHSARGEDLAKGLGAIVIYGKYFQVSETAAGQNDSLSNEGKAICPTGPRAILVVVRHSSERDKEGLEWLRKIGR